MCLGRVALLDLLWNVICSCDEFFWLLCLSFLFNSGFERVHVWFWGFDFVGEVFCLLVFSIS